MPLLPATIRNIAVLAALLPAVVVAAAAPAPVRYRHLVVPLLAEYCYGCHADGMKEGNVTLDEFESDLALLGNHSLWLRVLKNVRAGLMPPAGEPRPSAEQLNELVNWIKRD